MFASFTICLGLQQIFSDAAETRVLYRRTLSACLVLLVVCTVLLFSDTMVSYGTGFGNTSQLIGFTPMFSLFCASMGEVTMRSRLRSDADVPGGWLASLVQAVYAYRAWHLLGCPRRLIPALAVLSMATGIMWRVLDLCSGTLS
jgi:hypothetical protein